MNQLVIKDIYSEVFQYLGDMQSSVDDALGKYAVEKINEKIAELSVKVQVWEDRYGCAFDVFSYRTAVDEDYVRRLNENPATAEWEADLLMWEHQSGELSKWYKRLQNILKKS